MASTSTSTDNTGTLDPSILRIPPEIWLRIFEHATHDPEPTETSNTDTILAFLHSSDRLGVRPVSRVISCISRVCKRWHLASRTLRWRYVVVSSPQRARKLAALLETTPPDSGRAQGSGPTLPTKRLDVIFEGSTLDLLSIEGNSSAGTRDFIDDLTNILLSSPALTTLSFIAPKTHNTNIVSILLTAAPSLKRLELCVSNDTPDSPGGAGVPTRLVPRHHHRSLEVLWLSPPRLHTNLAADHDSIVLPRVHTLILQELNLSTEDFNRNDSITPVVGLQLPSLRTCIALAEPRPISLGIAAGPPRSPPRAFIKSVKHIYGFALPDLQSLDKTEWRNLETLGLTLAQFSSLHLESFSQATNLKTLLITFKQRALAFSWTEENLYLVASRERFPSLEVLRISIPYEPVGAHEMVRRNLNPGWAMTRVQLLSMLEQYVWMERLEKLSQKGVAIEIGVSDDWWTARKWERVSARAASGKLNGAWASRS